MRIGTVQSMADARDAREKKKRKKKGYFAGIWTPAAWVRSTTYLTQVFIKAPPSPPREVPEWVPLGKTPNQREKETPEKSRANGDVPRRNVCRCVEPSRAGSSDEHHCAPAELHLATCRKPRPGPFVAATADTRHLIMRSWMRKQSQQED